MSLDAVMYASGDLTFNASASWIPTAKDYNSQEERVYHDTNERYFCNVYPHGNWLTLLRELGELREAFPHATIWYADDHTLSYYPDAADEVTPKFISDMTRIWWAVLHGEAQGE